jgi:peptide/nickel transport system ATP-binding protein
MRRSNIGNPERASEAHVGGEALFARDLKVRIESGDAIVEDTEIRLGPGEILGLVGESGSGKTTTALALLGYSGPGVRIADGTLHVAGKTLRMDESMRASRGSVISYVPQNPGRALNPSTRIVAAIEELLDCHHLDRGEGGAVALGLLDMVGLPGDPAFGRRFPHQLSGGQQQRVCIAASLSCSPAVVVLDEPTTGLDVVTQARILEQLVRLRDERDLSMVYVTHDLAVVSQIADRIAVMYAGRIVEQGTAESVLQRPRHPYTRGLLASIPDHVAPRLLEPMPGISVGVGDRPEGCAFAPRCRQVTDECRAAMPELRDVAAGHQVRCLHWQQTPPVNIVPLQARQRDTEATGPTVLEVRGLAAEHRSRRETVVVAHDVNFAVARGQCVALVGESGSGKTTIARVIAGLHPVSAGEVLLDGQTLPDSASRRTVEQRRRIQLIFQNPAEALNPRHTVRGTIARPAQLLRRMTRTDANAEVDRLLEHVRLSARSAERYPRELSGGEQQRVAIARALAANPDVILCDEITSALDVSIQAAVLKLLTDLQAELGLTLLFITHDLGVVATIADEVLLLEQGRVCEQGPTATVLTAPKHPYTRKLLDAAPSVAGALTGTPGVNHTATTV